MKGAIVHRSFRSSMTRIAEAGSPGASRGPHVARAGAVTAAGRAVRVAETRLLAAHAFAGKVALGSGCALLLATAARTTSRAARTVVALLPAVGFAALESAGVSLRASAVAVG